MLAGSPAIEPATDAAPDLVLLPGFVDLQVNGIDDVDVATADGDDWTRLDRLLVQQGVTSWCPTLVTMPLDRYAAPLQRIAEAIDRPAGWSADDRRRAPGRPVPGRRPPAPTGPS